MILHRTHFKRARPWASGAGRNNANYEQQSFYQLNKLYQHAQRLIASSFVDSFEHFTKRCPSSK